MLAHAPCARIMPQDAHMAVDDDDYTTTIEEADLWRAAENAADTCNFYSGDADDLVGSDDEDAAGNNVLLSLVESGRSRIVRLPDGDVHICDDDCPYTQCGRDCDGRPNGDRVCEHTGRVVRHYCEARTDSSTGRGYFKTGDTDGEAGFINPPLHRRDTRRASMQAFITASSISETNLPTPTRAPPVVPKLKGIASTPARTPPRRAMFNAERRRAEAEELYNRLLNNNNTKKNGHQKKTLTQTPHNTCPITNATTSCISSTSAVFATLLRKYLNELKLCGGHPSMDEICNISLSIQSVRTTDSIALNIRGDVALRSLASTLAVALWQCAHATPYLQLQHKTSVSFRPFCVGVYYAFKRGVVLANGAVLIPKVPSLTISTCTRRNSGGGSDASLKALKSSSHRGLRTLHRCIASVGPDEVDVFFGCAVRVAQGLVRHHGRITNSTPC